MPFSVTWMDMEIISQRQIPYDIDYMQNLKKLMQMNLPTKQKQIHGL